MKDSAAFKDPHYHGVTGVTYLTGTQFGRVTGITSAWVARIGAGFIF